MKIRQIAKAISQKTGFARQESLPTVPKPYSPTPYLSHPFLQSCYNIYEASFDYKFKRERLFFQDGGHISLDWSADNEGLDNPPILFIMHGLTGGSEMNYIKAIMNEATAEGFYSVCLNSRGINNQMTSPIPFTSIQYYELEAALGRVAIHHPNSPIYLIGTSFGGNYLLRYLMRNKVSTNIKGLVALAPPINVTKVVSDMGSIYQKFFVERYIKETVLKHPEMKFWEDLGIINMKKVVAARNLTEFHEEVTAKILGYEGGAEQIFRTFTIQDDEIGKMKHKTLVIVSKDDPIVSYASMPLDSLHSNPNIAITATEKGGHLCWFEGSIPKRWYPKPIFEFLGKLRKQDS